MATFTQVKAGRLWTGEDEEHRVELQVNLTEYVEQTLEHLKGSGPLAPSLPSDH